jgi:hypothetical protein
MGMKGSLALLYGMAAIAGGGFGLPTPINEHHLNNPANYKGKSTGNKLPAMREFVIKGVSIQATNLKMAKKKYHLLQSKKK